MSSGPQCNHAAPGLRATGHGDHEEMDEPESQERQRVFHTTTPDVHTGGEAGGPPWRWGGLHQPV